MNSKVDLINQSVEKFVKSSPCFKLDFVKQESENVTCYHWFITSEYHVFDLLDIRQLLNLASSLALGPWFIKRNDEVTFEICYFV